jgi:hypothetical protein
MPYADVTKRRTYHAGYMQQWRARKAQQTPVPVPGAPQLEASAALVNEARRLHVEALELAYHPARVVELLRRITGLLLQITEASTPPQP